MHTQQGTLTPAATRVLAAASDLFYSRGINTVGMELIAEEAGVTKKTIYDRFGSKENLVVSYLRTRNEQWKRLLLARLDRVGAPRERILATFDVLGDWLATDAIDGCALVKSFVELTDSHPGRAVASSQKEWLRALYQDLASQAGSTDPEAQADTLLVLHEGAIVAHTVAGRTDATAAARRTAEMLLGDHRSSGRSGT